MKLNLQDLLQIIEDLIEVKMLNTHSFINLLISIGLTVIVNIKNMLVQVSHVLPKRSSISVFTSGVTHIKNVFKFFRGVDIL